MALGLGRDAAAARASRPRVIERRVYIKAPPSTVWAALHDARNAEAVHGELRLGPATGAWPAAGSVRSARLRLGVLRETATVESLEARPGARFRYRLVADDLSSEWSWSFQPLAGGTRVVHAAAVQPGSPIASARWTGWLAGFGRDVLAGTVEAHLRGLKSVSEAPAVPDDAHEPESAIRS